MVRHSIPPVRADARSRNYRHQAALPRLAALPTAGPLQGGGGNACLGNGPLLCQRTYIQQADTLWTQVSHSTAWTAQEAIQGGNILTRCPNTGESNHCQISTKVMSEGQAGLGELGYFGLRFYDQDDQSSTNSPRGCFAVLDNAISTTINIMLDVSGSATVWDGIVQFDSTVHDYSLSWFVGTTNPELLIVNGGKVVVTMEAGDLAGCFANYLPPGFVLQINTRENDDGVTDGFEDVVLTIEEVWYGTATTPPAPTDPTSLTDQIGWHHKLRWIIEEEF